MLLDTLLPKSKSALSLSDAQRRYVSWASRLLWKQKIPFGLVSPYLLFGKRSPARDTHRQVLASSLPKLPRLLFHIINTWIWLRWVFFYAWRSTYLSVKHMRRGVTEKHGVTLWQQARQSLSLALLHTVAPQDYYKFRLYLPENKDQWAHYIYNTELPAFHMLGDSNESRQERELLSDKLLFEQQMRDKGLNVCNSHFLPAGADYAEFETSAKGVLFCKPRSGNQARGAFKLEWIDSEPLLQLAAGPKLSGDNARTFIGNRLSAQDYLVQPFHANHPALLSLQAEGNEPAVLRAITRNQSGKIVIYCAYIEVPLKTVHYKYYLSVLASPSDGKLDSCSVNRQMIPKALDGDYLEQQMAGLTLPCWSQVVDLVDAAHRHFSHIYSIAWDLIITPDGPILLEGNSNWRIDQPQVLTGGILQCHQ